MPATANRAQLSIYVPTRDAF